jgi:hypothetical protein
MLAESPQEVPSKISANASAADLHQLAVLNEILAAKNDNDPRLDTELRHLSPAAKKLLEEKYQQLPTEKRNQRGTIAFLIGRDLNSTDDVAFLTQILKEAPCLSMADCSKETPINNQATDLVAGAEKMHEETGADVTLHYPQLMVLAQIQAQLDQEPAKAFPPGVTELIQTAAHSPVGRIASKAQGLLQNYQSRL